MGSLGRMGRWIRFLFRHPRPGFCNGVPRRSQFQLLGTPASPQSLALGHRLAKPDVDRRQHDRHYDHKPEYHPGRGHNYYHTQNIKNMLKMYGPMMTAVLSTNDLYNSPADILANYRTPTAGVDHAVAVEGYWTIRAFPPADTGSLRIAGVQPAETEPATMTFLTATYRNSWRHRRDQRRPSITPGTLLSGTWTGSHGTAWTNSSGDAYRNWSGLTWWISQETQATFDSTGQQPKHLHLQLGCRPRADRKQRRHRLLV